MGVTLALRPLKRVPVELGFIVPMKLIAHPVMMYLGLSLIGDFEPVWVYTAVLLASLPTATNVFVIAQQYSTWVERASATVLVTTVMQRRQRIGPAVVDHQRNSCRRTCFPAELAEFFICTGILARLNIFISRPCRNF
jgi:hypothetical protein